MNPPKRPLGVTLTAVASILGSVPILLLAALMMLLALLATRTAGAPPHMTAILAGQSAVWIAFAAWGITTAIGLLRVRGWARWSTIAFSALLLICCAPGAVLIALLPLPSPTGASTVARIALVVSYFLLALLGGLWLWYFNTAALRGVFGASAQPAGSRPVSITIVAWFMIVGGAAAAIGVIFAWPVMLFHLVIQGGASRVLFLLFAVWELLTGRGLLRLGPRSRIWAIVFFSFALVNGLVSALAPDLPGRLWFAMSFLPSWWPGKEQMGTVVSAMKPAMIAGALVAALPIWFLIARRAAFRSEQIGSEQPL
ncbi:MAG TPA: hypothetical protein VMJ34_09080 [Bryobacteraceae bacterium]|nr:hypothetical protein [Bryobacteraceae bacterium]